MSIYWLEFIEKISDLVLSIFMASIPVTVALFIVTIDTYFEKVCFERKFKFKTMLSLFIISFIVFSLSALGLLFIPDKDYIRLQKIEYMMKNGTAEQVQYLIYK